MNPLHGRSTLLKAKSRYVNLDKHNESYVYFKLPLYII